MPLNKETKPLFNAKSLYIYIKYLYELVWLGNIAYQPLKVI